MQAMVRSCTPPSVFVALLSMAAGCGGSRQLQEPAPTDCRVEGQYREWVVENYDTWSMPGTTPGWYSYGDPTPGAVITGLDGGPTWPEGGLRWTWPIEDGGPCGTRTAMLLQSHGFQDYGSGFGTYSFGNNLQSGCTGPDGAAENCSIDAGAFDGIRFWARTVDLRTEAIGPEDTTKTVTLAINDKTSYAGGYGSVCTLYIAPDSGQNIAGPGSASMNSGVNSSSLMGSSVGAYVLPADACGNAFSYPLVTSDRWQFYTIPFSAFTQAPRPNRIPTGFDPSSFFQFVVVVPKEARLELWIANLGFYGSMQDAGRPETGP
ncbi:MAG: hypothetical protein M3O46_21650 [Myxococcota bacterium]|nr:hypothetical protein [Myxococcota bacterium]